MNLRECTRLAILQYAIFSNNIYLFNSHITGLGVAYRLLALFRTLVYNQIAGERSFSFGGSMSLPDATVTEMYDHGKSCAEVARIDECSETSMYNRLISLGVTMRSRSEANQIFPDSIFISLYNLGLSSSQIGRMLGVNSSTVTKRLHTLKFPLRSRGVACRIRYSEQEFQRHFMNTDMLNQLTELAGIGIKE